ncbi:MAG: hypothetical protein QXG08_06220 [Candidatus Methanomethyliaceae archaeon]
MKPRQKYLHLPREGGVRLPEGLLGGEDEVRREADTGIPVVRPKGARKPFIRTTNISDIIRAAMRKAGFPWRPYVLRSYFDTQLMLAESKGLIIRDYRQFFMGHKGDIENRYTTNKCRLPPDVVEDMRSSYARCLDYLETDRPRTDQDELIVAFRRHILSAVGFRKEEIERMNLFTMTDEEVHDMIKQKLAGIMIGNGQRQRVVPVEDVETYIARGWEFVAALPNDKVVMRIPF